MTSSFVFVDCRAAAPPLFEKRRDANAEKMSQKNELSVDAVFVRTKHISHFRFLPSVDWNNYLRFIRSGLAHERTACVF